MNADDPEPRKRGGEALAALIREDLSPLGVVELEHRIGTLEAEIQRVKTQIERKKGDRSAAESFFKPSSS